MFRSVQKQGMILLLDLSFGLSLMKLPLWYSFISGGLMDVLSQEFIYRHDDK